MNLSFPRIVGESLSLSIVRPLDEGMWTIG